MNLCRRQSGALVLYAGHESYLIVHVYSRAVLRHMFCNLEYYAPVWMSSAEAHLSLLETVDLRAEGLCEGELCCLGTEGRAVPCVCSMRFMTERITLCMSICIISLQLVILEVQLPCVQN